MLYSESLQREFRPSFSSLGKSIIVNFRLTGDWLTSVVGAPPPMTKADDSTEENQQTFIYDFYVSPVISVIAQWAKVRFAGSNGRRIKASSEHVFFIFYF